MSGFLIQSLILQRRNLKLNVLTKDWFFGYEVAYVIVRAKEWSVFKWNP